MKTVRDWKPGGGRGNWQCESEVLWNFVPQSPFATAIQPAK
ncbi:hypothetical protein [Hungatella hathewayi]|nr:hypothetical protein [Hungatella hathewayi]